MLLPFRVQQRAPLPNGRIGEALAMAIIWWFQVLKLQLCQEVPLAIVRTPVIELFCDAASKPPCVAGVGIHRGAIMYTAFEVNHRIMRALEVRKDDQIMALELLAILVSLRTWGHVMSGTTVRVWTDNVGAQCTLEANYARRHDHNLIVFAIMLVAAQFGFRLWFERVGTDDNIADEPSRGKLDTLRALGAVWVPPVGTHDLHELDKLADPKLLQDWCSRVC